MIWLANQLDHQHVGAVHLPAPTNHLTPILTFGGSPCKQYRPVAVFRLCPKPTFGGEEDRSPHSQAYEQLSKNRSPNSRTGGDPAGRVQMRPSTAPLRPGGEEVGIPRRNSYYSVSPPTSLLTGNLKSWATGSAPVTSHRS